MFKIGKIKKGMFKYEPIRLNVKVLKTEHKKKYNVIAPERVKCPEGWTLIITEDGFVACAKEKEEVS